MKRGLLLLCLVCSTALSAHFSGDSLIFAPDTLIFNQISPEINDKNFPYYVSIDGNSMFFNTEQEFNRVAHVIPGFPINLTTITITDLRVYDVILDQPLPYSCSMYGIIHAAAGDKIYITGKLNFSDLRNPRIDNLNCKIKLIRK